MRNAPTQVQDPAHLLHKEAQWRAAGPRLWFLRTGLSALAGAGVVALLVLTIFLTCVLVWHGAAGLALLLAPEQWVIVVFFTVSLGVLAGISRHVFPAGAGDLRELRPHLTCGPATQAALASALTRYPLFGSLRVIPVAATIGTLHVLLLGETTPLTGIQVAASIGTLLIWQMMFQIAMPLIHNARLFALLGHCCRIDLYRPDYLTAFGRTAVRPCLLIIALQCSYAIFLLSDRATLSPGLLLGLGASMGLVAGLFFLPLKGVRQNIRATRTAALQQVDRALGVMSPATPPLPSSELQRTSALLVLREQLRQVSSWPLGFAGVWRLLFYLVLVPLTWVGAATVEMLLDGRL